VIKQTTWKGKLALSTFAVAGEVCLTSAHSTEVRINRLELKAGQAITVPALIANGKVALGQARLGKFGEMQPADGELMIGLAPRDKTLYENVVVIQRTSKPVDFVATGLIGNIKIDEIVLHGRLDGTVISRIGAVSWTVSLNGFEIGDDQTAK
jgi:hypothetical protein